MKENIQNDRTKMPELPVYKAQGATQRMDLGDHINSMSQTRPMQLSPLNTTYDQHTTKRTMQQEDNPYKAMDNLLQALGQLFPSYIGNSVPMTSSNGNYKTPGLSTTPTGRASPISTTSSYVLAVAYDGQTDMHTVSFSYKGNGSKGTDSIAGLLGGTGTGYAPKGGPSSSTSYNASAGKGN